MPRASHDLVGPAVVHSEGRVRYATEAFLALVGADSRDSVLGADVTEFVHPKYREALAAQFERVARGEASGLGLSAETRRTGGPSRDVIAVTSPVEWEGTSRLQTLFIDVTEAVSPSEGSVHSRAMHEAPIGVTIADATREDEPLIYVNDGFVELTGYSREEIIGQNCRFLQGEQTRDEPVAEVRAAIDAEEPVTVVLRNYRKDGTMFWNRLTVSPIEDEGGTVTHFLGFQEDVSDAKLYEREKTIFEKHAEATEQAMFITDSEGVIQYVNPAFERTTGYAAAEAIGQTPRILTSGQQDEAFYEDLWETISSGEVWEAELTNRSKDGELYRVRQTIVPIKNDRGEVTHYTAIECDITNEQFTEQVLDVLNRVLRHNVRTSINVIDGYAEMLESELDDEGHRHAARTIKERTETLEKVSRQTTTVRNLFQGRGDPDSLPLGAIEKFVEECRASHPEAQIELSIDADREAKIKNGSALGFALEEAIENAVVHNDRDPPRVWISVDRVDDRPEACIEIADNGPGIPDSEWDVITAGKETPLLHSSGIGLWIIYWTVRALGGTVESGENEPRGSVVTARIPIVSDGDDGDE